MTDSIIYEMNLRGFTGDAPELGQLQGTYKGLSEKIPYLKELGITSVELMPIMEFDKVDWPHFDPVTGEQLVDSWGYSTLAYQAPEGRFSSDLRPGAQVNEFKSLIRELHNNGIEVILDIVFNHTREGSHLGPTFSFKGLDNNIYYMLAPGRPEFYIDKTGCGNTLNCNDPVVQQLILDTLRYWVTEMHVDGFRFDLATIFKYDVDLQEKMKTPIIEAIENDPVLSKIKLIAEPWGPEQYWLGRYSDKRWAEWNGSFRDVVRKFAKGDTGQVGVLADRVVGSPAWFDPAKERSSVNIITCHDGFTLYDLVSYNEKHNWRNGENNRDGSNDNNSWNSGVEGPVKDSNLPIEQQISIENLRTRQMKNMLLLLFLSRGTPMLLYGDEVRRTAMGNNNAYCQDRLNMFPWASVEESKDMLRFTKMSIAMRQDHKIGRLLPDAFTWHGAEPNKPNWADWSRLLAWQTKPIAGTGSLYSAFNSHWEPVKVTLPEGNWRRLADTNLPTGQDFVTYDQGTPIASEYWIQPRSGILLESK